MAEQWRRLKGADVTEADIDTLYADFIPLQVNVIVDYADLIPGTVEAIRDFRARGLKIGTTTGYNRAMVEALAPAAKARGYDPDSIVAADDVSAARPAPWMCFRNMELLGVYPAAACVKVGDTVPDIDEGLNAGMWTVGLTLSGNEVALSPEEIASRPTDEVRALNEAATRKLRGAGAHYVVDTIADVPALIDDIEQRLRKGERP